MQRLVVALRQRGDKAVVHGLRGRPSNRKIEEEVEREAVEILSAPLYQGFGPALASEYLRDRHGIEASKETVRQWMMGAKRWRGRKAKIKEVHLWRPRRSRFGELVQWDTSEHDWLEGRGEKLYLIAMIDDATSRLLGRFVRSDSTEENMRVLWSYVERFGRPVAFYTDKASLFQTAAKRKRDEPGVEQDPKAMPPTQIGWALRELGINWIAAHSPQAKGRLERNFGTAQDRLVKGMRVAGVKTLEEANRYLEEEYLVWWERELTVEAANSDNAHRRLEKGHDLAASLSYVEERQVKPNYTLPWFGIWYRILPRAVTPGLRGATVRVEQRLDGSLAVRHGERHLPIEECPKEEKKVKPAALPAQANDRQRSQPRSRGGDWNRNFGLKKAPKLWYAIAASGCRRGDD